MTFDRRSAEVNAALVGAMALGWGVRPRGDAILNRTATAPSSDPPPAVEPPTPGPRTARFEVPVRLRGGKRVDPRAERRRTP